MAAVNPLAAAVTTYSLKQSALSMMTLKGFALSFGFAFFSLMSRGKTLLRSPMRLMLRA